MTTRRGSAWRVALAAGLIFGPALLRAGDVEEFKVKRQELYQFVQPPRVSGQGDRWEIRFESAAACDATVAIEDRDGRILRHLASGVLGPNAPAPFAPNALAQTIAWDGKDDQGRYIDDKSRCRVRVSLGLRPRFERSLFWSPHKRSSGQGPIFVPAPQGVYVLDGGVVDHLRLFDHNGDYRRTIYPFPADALQKFSDADLHWQRFPQDDARLPLKEGEHQATLFSSGDNAGFGTFGVGPKHQTGSAGSALAVHGQRVAVAKIKLNRVSTAGTPADGLPFVGPKVSLTRVSKALAWRGGGDAVEAVPLSACFSPDGRWLYFTGFHWIENHGTGGMVTRYLHGVTRMAFDGQQPPQLLVGSLDDTANGDAPTQLAVPVSVACDAAGRLYVADYMNDRVQVFDPADPSKPVASIATAKPSHVAVDPKTGQIVVLSWQMRNQLSWRDRGFSVKASYARFGPLPEARPLVRCPLSLAFPDSAGGSAVRAGVDFFADPPTVWLSPGSPRSSEQWPQAGTVLLVEQDGKLAIRRDVGQEVVSSIRRASPPANLRQRLYVSPTTGLLHLAEGDAGVGKSTGQLLQIDPSSGKVTAIELPFDAEDFAFDPQGNIYLRSLREIGHFDVRTWREIPWDYGQEVKSAGFATSKAEGAGKRNAPLASGLAIPVRRYNHHGGMHVSADGKLAVAIHGNQFAGIDRAEENLALPDAKPYTVRVFPGRHTFGLVLVFDRFGQIVHDDAIPGIAFTHGVGIDRNDNLYVMAMAARVLDGQRYFNEATDTLIKFRPGQGRILSTGKTPVPLPDRQRPQGPADLSAPGGGRLHQAWAEGALWFYGGLGFHARHGAAEGFGCDCFNSRFDLDYFARSFAPEVDHSSVAVLDSNGNLICRIGRYGNIDDGRPLLDSTATPAGRAIGGDEVSFCYAPYVATQTDRRLFVADPGNARIVAIRLDYHATQMADFPAASR